MLGAEGYQAFQRRVVDRLADARTGSPVQALPRQEAERIVWEHDGDGDGALDSDEANRLSRALAASPGGFGQAPPAGIDVLLLSERLQQFDVNGDGVLVPDELPERMRPFFNGDADQDGALSPEELHAHLRITAYERLVWTGIYIGGGFANTLAHSRQALEEIDLPEEARRRATALIASHRERLERLTAETLSIQRESLRQDLSNGPLEPRPLGSGV